jgi:hypothetical protein
VIVSTLASGGINYRDLLNLPARDRMIVMGRYWHAIYGLPVTFDAAMAEYNLAVSREARRTDRHAPSRVSVNLDSLSGGRMVP